MISTKPSVSPLLILGELLAVLLKYFRYLQHSSPDHSLLHSRLILRWRRLRELQKELRVAKLRVKSELMEMEVEAWTDTVEDMLGRVYRASGGK